MNRKIVIFGGFYVFFCAKIKLKSLHVNVSQNYTEIRGLRKEI